MIRTSIWLWNCKCSSVIVVFSCKKQTIKHFLTTNAQKTTFFLVNFLNCLTHNNSLTGGELFDRIVNDFPNGYNEKTACRIIKDIIDAIKFLHSKGVVHRDLKPENLIYANKDQNSEIKITDFGLGMFFCLLKF